MAERRKHGRFALASPIDAFLSVLQHVRLEPGGNDGAGHEIAILATAPGVRGEEATVCMGPADAVQMTFVGRIAASEPCVVGDRLMHRIRLVMVGSVALSSGGGAPANSWRAAEVTTAVLVRRHAVRIVNLGPGGCRIELSTELPVGTVARLHAGGRPGDFEPVRVDFSRARRGISCPYVAGLEFLALHLPSSHSLRSLATRLEGSGHGTLGHVGEDSVFRLTSPDLGPLEILSIVCAETCNDRNLHAFRGSRQGQPEVGSRIAGVGGTKTEGTVEGAPGIDD
jgi:hypothetical protein